MSQQLNLDHYVGQEAEPPRVARYAVNEAMVRNWVEAHDDYNPVYVDAEAARATGRDSIITPPAMISTWVMQGYRRHRDVQQMRVDGHVEDHAYSRLLAELDAAGYTSVVATNLEQKYHREVVPGDHITCNYRIESIVGPKRTGLGEGYFINLLKRFVDQNNELVVEENFRLLRFNPDTQNAPQEDA